MGFMRQITQEITWVIMLKTTNYFNQGELGYLAPPSNIPIKSWKPGSTILVNFLSEHPSDLITKKGKKPALTFSWKILSQILPSQSRRGWFASPDQLVRIIFI